LLHFIRKETNPVIPLRMTMRQGNPEKKILDCPIKLGNDRMSGLQ
jgi:hypothetical protein